MYIFNNVYNVIRFYLWANLSGGHLYICLCDTKKGARYSVYQMSSATDKSRRHLTSTTSSLGHLLSPDCESFTPQWSGF